MFQTTSILIIHSHRIHGAAISGNMDPINIPQMLAYIYIYVYIYIPAPWIRLMIQISGFFSFPQSNEVRVVQSESSRRRAESSQNECPQSQGLADPRSLRSSVERPTMLRPTKKQ